MTTTDDLKDTSGRMFATIYHQVLNTGLRFGATRPPGTDGRSRVLQGAELRRRARQRVRQAQVLTEKGKSGKVSFFNTTYY